MLDTNFELNIMSESQGASKFKNLPQNVYVELASVTWRDYVTYL